MHISGNPIQSISLQSNLIQMTWRSGARCAAGPANIGVKRRAGRRRYGDAATTNGRNKSTSPAQIPLDILYIECLELETPINSILGVVDMFSLLALTLFGFEIESALWLVAIPAEIFGLWFCLIIEEEV